MQVSSSSWASCLSVLPGCCSVKWPRGSPPCIQLNHQQPAAIYSADPKIFDVWWSWSWEGLSCLLRISVIPIPRQSLLHAGLVQLHSACSASHPQKALRLVGSQRSGVKVAQGRCPSKPNEGVGGKEPEMPFCCYAYGTLWGSPQRERTPPFVARGRGK